MAGYQQHLDALGEAGAAVVAASVDSEENAAKIAADLSFPVGYGVTREQADSIGSFWEERRGIVQPSEFLIRADGTVATSTYSAGPLGRTDPQEVLRLIAMFESK